MVILGLTAGAIILLLAGPAWAQLDTLLKGLPAPSGTQPGSGLTEAKIVSGLKEAHVLGQEERSFRANPSARVTDRLKEVCAR
jgi:hypothetical protein